MYRIENLPADKHQIRHVEIGRVKQALNKKCPDGFDQPDMNRENYFFIQIIDEGACSTY